MPPVIAYVGIGANLGDALKTVQHAIVRLSRLRETRLCEQSSLFRTAPIDAEGDDYVNAVASIETRLDSQTLLQELQIVESEFGRERPYLNAARTLDLDILLYGNRQIKTDTLVVPHPRLTERAFALIPLLQIDPLISIPGRGAAHLFVQALATQSIAKINA